MTENPGEETVNECHCGKKSDNRVEDVVVCASCEAFLVKYPHLRETLLAQWRAKAAARSKAAS